MNSQATETKNDASEVGAKPQQSAVYSFRPGAKGISLRPGGGKLSSLSSSPLEVPSSGYIFPVQVSKLDTEFLSRNRKRYTIDELLTYRQVWTKLPSELVDSNFEILTSTAENNQSEKDIEYARQPDAAMDDRDWRSRSSSADSAPQEASQKFQASRKSSASDTASRSSETRQGNGNHQMSLKEAPPIVRASNPWLPRRDDVDDKEKVMRTVKGILNKLTPEKFDLLIEQLISAGISSASILQDVIKLVFDKAVLEPTFCSIYAEMCYRLSKALPEFPGQPEEGRSAESAKPFTFRRVLLNTCQEEFEGSSNLRTQIRSSGKTEQREELEKKLKMRTLGNIRLIGELFKQKMIPEKIVHACIQNLLTEAKSEFSEENVEALCHLLATVGKEMEESVRSKDIIKSYMDDVRDLSNTRHLSSRTRFMCKDLIELRSNAWIPRREEVKARKLDEIHAEAEEKLGLKPGATANMKGIMSSSSRNALFPPAPNSLLHPSMESDGWETVPVNRRGKKDASFPSSSSGSLPSRGQSALIGGVGMRKANIMSKEGQSQNQSQNGSQLIGKSSALLSGSSAKPNAVPSQTSVTGLVKSVTEGDSSVPVSVSASSQWNDSLKKKSLSLLREYFSIADLKEALLCVQEMKMGRGSEAIAEFVNCGVLTAFEGKDNDRILFSKLLPYLFLNKALGKEDMVRGFSILGKNFEDLSLDLPRSPSQFGVILAHCVKSECIDSIATWAIVKVIDDYRVRREVIVSVVKTMKEIGNENGVRVLFENKEVMNELRGEGESENVLEAIEKLI